MSSDGRPTVPTAPERARPALPIRGTVEGFYGPPWSHAERLAHLRFSASVGLNTYAYAPKDDPYHRHEWRTPYPPARLAQLAELARTAAELGVRFVVALHPALSMRFEDDDEHAALHAKAAQLQAAGVASFALLFDDVPYGDDPAALGRAHGDTCRRFRAAGHPLLFGCPTDYAGTAASAYRDGWSAAAPDDLLVAWTGPAVVCGAVPAADVELAAVAFGGRRLLLWDNFPVNDFDPSRLFLGPLTGREAAPSLGGVLANPMIQSVPSRIPLVTVADWARDPAGYEPERSWRGALALSRAGHLEPLARACSSWPPSADQDPELSAACAAALAGSAADLALLERRFTELAQCCAAPDAPADLVAGLRAWLAGAGATARAGLAAVRVLRAPSPSSRADARAALEASERHFESVLRTVVPPFVRDVLERTAPQRPAAGGAPVARLVTGPQRTPGDRATAELLQRAGFALGDGSPELVVLTASAAREDAVPFAGAAVPVLAWGQSVIGLGMATAAGAVMSWEPLRITAADDPMAAGLGGAVDPYRGTNWLAAATTAPGATVVARSSEGAALYRFAAGDPLADGTPAPAARVGLFLNREGPAAWLLSEAGWSLLAAALQLVAPDSSPTVMPYGGMDGPGT